MELVEHLFQFYSISRSNLFQVAGALSSEFNKGEPTAFQIALVKSLYLCEKLNYDYFKQISTSVWGQNLDKF